MQQHQDRVVILRTSNVKMKKLSVLFVYLLLCRVNSSSYTCAISQLTTALFQQSDALSDIYSSVISDGKLLVDYVLKTEGKVIPAYSQEFDQLVHEGAWYDNSTQRISDFYMPWWSGSRVYNFSCGSTLSLNESGCTYITSNATCNMSLSYHCLDPSNKQQFLFDLFKTIDYVIPSIQNPYISRIYSYDIVGGIRIPRGMNNLFNLIDDDFIWDIFVDAVDYYMNSPYEVYWHPTHLGLVSNETVNTMFLPVVWIGQLLGMICIDVAQMGIAEGQLLLDDMGTVIYSQQGVAHVNLNTLGVKNSLLSSIHSIQSVSSTEWLWQRLNLKQIGLILVSTIPTLDIQNAYVWNYTVNGNIIRSEVASQQITIHNLGNSSVCWSSESWLTISPRSRCLQGGTSAVLHIEVDWKRQDGNSAASISILPNITQLTPWLVQETSQEFIPGQLGPWTSCFQPLFIQVILQYDMIEGEQVIFTLNSTVVILSIILATIGGWLSGLLMEHAVLVTVIKEESVSSTVDLTSSDVDVYALHAKYVWWILSGLISTLSGVWSGCFLILCSLKANLDQPELLSVSVTLWMIGLLSTLCLMWLTFWYMQYTKSNRIYKLERRRVTSIIKYIVLSLLLVSGFVTCSICSTYSISHNMRVVHNWNILGPVIVMLVALEVLVFRIGWFSYRTLAYLGFTLPSNLFYLIDLSTSRMYFVAGASATNAITANTVINVSIALSCTACITCILINNKALHLSREAMNKELVKYKQKAYRWEASASEALEKYNMAKFFLTSINNLRPLNRHFMNKIYLDQPRVQLDIARQTKTSSEDSVNAILQTAPPPVLPRHRTIKTTPLDIILRNPACLEFFKDVLKNEHSEELVMFWLDVEVYESRYEKMSSEERRVMAINLNSQYILEGSPYQVNVAGTVTQKVQSNLAAASRDLFTSAKKVCMSLMEQNTYKRFTESPEYDTCVDILEKSDITLGDISFTQD